MSPYDVFKRADALRDRVAKRPRVTMTELARSKAWREELDSSGVVEVTDRGETAAWIVSDDEMQALMEAYTLMEEQSERASLAAMLEARKNDVAVSGEELKRGALAALEKHLDEWQRIAHEYRK